jgi:hypothetical protein
MKTILIWLVLWILIQTLYLYFAPTDSTDISKWKRSGLGVYTDNATGVQYVKAGWFGGITPRLNHDGSLFNAKGF